MRELVPCLPGSESKGRNKPHRFVRSHCFSTVDVGKSTGRWPHRETGPSPAAAPDRGLNRLYPSSLAYFWGGVTAVKSRGWRVVTTALVLAVVKTGFPVAGGTGGGLAFRAAWPGSGPRKSMAPCATGGGRGTSGYDSRNRAIALSIARSRSRSASAIPISARSRKTRLGRTTAITFRLRSISVARWVRAGSASASSTSAGRGPDQIFGRSTFSAARNRSIKPSRACRSYPRSRGLIIDAIGNPNN